MRLVGCNRLLRWLAAFIAGLSYVLVFACNSPYIPIPPPNGSYSQDPASGDWSVSMPADSRAIGARYFVYNADLGSGLIQQTAPDGSMYAFPLHGVAGDRIEIHWEKSATDTSSTICRRLGEGLVTQGCQ